MKLFAKGGAFIILGIDPGFSVTGYSVLKQEEGGKAYLLDFGYLSMKSKDSLSIRVGQFYSLFEKIIKKFSVTTVALETPFLGKNAQTFLKLGYLRGVLYLLADQNGLEICEFAPREVKVSVAGFGGATKEQVANVIMRLFPKLSQVKKIAKNDVTDAMAVSVCGLWSARHKRRGLL
jgi:crossover junction endodeoxyribonuclease RuvC